MLLAGVSDMGWWSASKRKDGEAIELPASDPLQSWESTPSQRATVKYFWTVAAVILALMGLGTVTAY